MKYCTVTEFARRLGVARQTVYNNVKKGRIPAAWMRGKMMIPAEALEREKSLLGTYRGLRAMKRPEAPDDYPQEEDHKYITLVYDPSGTLVVGYGRFERHEFVYSCRDGVWPEGSIWKGTGGTKKDQLYRIEGMRMVPIAGNGRVRWEMIQQAVAA